MTPPSAQTQGIMADDPSVDQRPVTGSLSRAATEAPAIFWLIGVEGGARLLSFGFYLLAAHVLDPSGFGVVQYTITVATVAFGGLQVLTTALMRELGAIRGAAGREAVLGSSLAAAVVLWIITSMTCLVLHEVGIARAAPFFGLLCTLSGMAVFQIYYSVARGIGDPARQAVSYVGASFAQLLAFGLLAALTNPSPSTALLVFGASSFVPVVIYEWFKPVLRRRQLRVSRDVMRELWRIGSPLLIAQVGYLLWNSVDQLWVQGTLGTVQVGLYASAKNLSLALLVIPSGITGVLLPRVSQLKRHHDWDGAQRLVCWATAAGFGVSGALAAILSVIRFPLLGALYGDAYRVAGNPLAILCVGMACYCGFSTLTMAAVGWGRPAVYTIGVSVAFIAELLILEFSGGHSLMTAALSYTSSMALALVFVAGMLVSLRYRRASRSLPGAGKTTAQ